MTRTSHRILFFNTLAFTVCFAAWVFNGVMVTFLVDNGVFKWGPAEIGGLGGFFCPIVFGYLLQWTGLWSSCWILMFALSAVCLWCLHAVVTRIVRRGAPHLAEEFEHKHSDVRERVGVREHVTTPTSAIATLSSIH